MVPKARHCLVGASPVGALSPGVGSRPRRLPSIRRQDRSIDRSSIHHIHCRNRHRHCRPFIAVVTVAIAAAIATAIAIAVTAAIIAAIGAAIVTATVTAFPTAIAAAIVAAIAAAATTLVTFVRLLGAAGRALTGVRPGPGGSVSAIWARLKRPRYGRRLRA